MRSDDPLLHVRDVRVGQGGRAVYRDFSIEFGRGVTAILGPNGVGKTTMVEAIADPTRIRSGSVRLGSGADAVGWSAPAEGLRPRRLREYFRRTGFLPQKWSTYGGFTVRESIEYVAWLKGLGHRQRQESVDRVLAELGLRERSTTLVRRLSGGIQQRVGLAEAFVHDPAVVLLDEPTVGLDPEQRSIVRDYVRARAGSCGVVVSTHITDDVRAIADRVVVISGGRAIFDGTPDDLAAAGGHDIESGYLAVVRGASDGTT